MSSQDLEVVMTKYDLKRLEMYTNQLVDYHLIMDLLPPLARFYFLNQMGEMHLSAAQAVSYILLLNTVIINSQLYAEISILLCLLPCLSKFVLGYSVGFGPATSNCG